MKNSRCRPATNTYRSSYIDDAVDALVHAATLATDEAPSYSVPAPETLNLKDLVERVNAITGQQINIEFGATRYRASRDVDSMASHPTAARLDPECRPRQGLNKMMAAIDD